jgi:hypothetical protein
MTQPLQMVTDTALGLCAQRIAETLRTQKSVISNKVSTLSSTKPLGFIVHSTNKNQSPKITKILGQWFVV